METALLNSPTMAIAHQRVEESKARYRQAIGQELPDVAIAPGFNRQRNSENLLAPNQSDFQNGGAGAQAFSPGNTTNIYTAPLEVNYNLDLFGKQRLTSKAAKAAVTSQAAREQQTLVDVTANVANAYINWQLANHQQRRTKELINNLSEQVQLTAARQQAGLPSAIPVEELNSRLLLAKENHAAYNQQMTGFQYQLAALVG